MTQIPIDSIAIESRHRHDFGDIGGLAGSIAAVGLLHPVVVTPDRVLVAGQRRIAACLSLGWSDIPVTIVDNLADAADLLRAEADENVQRKDFTPSEAESIAAAREELLRPLAERRKKAGKIVEPSGNLPEGQRPRDVASIGTGYSASTLRKVREVKATAADESKPEPVREAAKQALADMDRSGRVDPHFNRVQAVEHEVTQQSMTELVERAAELGTVTPEAAERFFDAEQRSQLAQFEKHLLECVIAARKVLKFDADRVGSLCAEDVVKSVLILTADMHDFGRRVDAARPKQLRVIAGGLR